MENYDAMATEDLKTALKQKINSKLKEYIRHKIQARNLREKGSIDRAMRHEKVCDEIYVELPTNLKW